MDDTLPPITPEELESMILLAGYQVQDFAAFHRWTDDERAQVEEWAGKLHLAANDNPVEVPPFPAFIGDTLRPETMEEGPVSRPLPDIYKQMFEDPFVVAEREKKKAQSAEHPILPCPVCGAEMALTTASLEVGRMYFSCRSCGTPWRFVLLPDHQPEKEDPHADDPIRSYRLTLNMVLTIQTKAPLLQGPIARDYQQRLQDGLKLVLPAILTGSGIIGEWQGHVETDVKRARPPLAPLDIE